MRNGNTLGSPKMLQVQVVLILPMRNGNTGEPVPTHIPGFGSYPTYEEWKLPSFNL